MGSELKDCQEFMAQVDDLDQVTRALARETVIRQAMAETGESREIVVEMLDASISMDQEAVLDLMEGEPTTLRAGLQRYVEELEGRDELQPRDRVISELDTLLAYPWPGRGELELVAGHPEDDEHLVITLGGEEVAAANHDEHGWAGMEAVQTTAEAVHKAILERLNRR